MLKAQKLSKADQQKIEAALAARVQRPTKQELKAQQLQDLRQSLEVAQRNVHAIKLQMRSLRGAE